MSSTIKNVVITGASTGIGRACALHLDGLGWRVFAGVRRRTDATSLQAHASDRLRPVFIDVTKAEMIRMATEQISQAVGSAGLDGLVNNAGLARGGPLEFLPVDEFRSQLEINVIGQVAVTQAFLPLLRLAQGRIINMSSISGRTALPFMGPYAASKFAMEALTDALRLELAPWGLEVVSIQPGAIETPIWEKSLGWADQMVDNLPERAKTLYGPMLDELRQTIAERGQNGLPPSAVARVVATALQTKRPKTRYLVGRDAKIGAFLAHWLPDRLRDWLISKNQGLAHE